MQQNVVKIAENINKVYDFSLYGCIHINVLSLSIVTYT